MTRGFLFHSVILMTMAILIFHLGDFSNIAASKPHNNDNSTDSTFSLPFNSHIVDKFTHEKEYSSSIIPFP